MQLVDTENEWQRDWSWKAWLQSQRHDDEQLRPSTPEAEHYDAGPA